MAVSGANLQNVFMLITLEPLLARNPFLVLHVRRDHLVSDALRELTVYSDVDLKKPLKVGGQDTVSAYQREDGSTTCDQARRSLSLSEGGRVHNM